MREIKFRGIPWDKNLFIYGSFIDAGSKKFIWNFRPIEVNPETVGQFTGLKDKNNKEVYEGDIVEVLLDGLEGYIKGEVFWDEERFCWNIKDSVGDDYYDYFSGKTPFEAIEEIEIVGNIHDNPQLLERDND